MKVLVSTTDTQGQRESDFCYVPIGALVYVGFMCDRDRREGPDGGCGCGRAFVGSSMSKGTTTALVADRALTRDDVRRKIGKSLLRDEWIDSLNDPLVDRVTDETLNIAFGFDVGVVVERRGEAYRERAPVSR